MKALALLLGGCFFLVTNEALQAGDKVIVHEWGTFTCLQDEDGKAVGGINVDDEPVPDFVFQYANRTVAAQYSPHQGNLGLPPYYADKGWVEGDPSVTMRLETPVLYFYPPKGAPPQSVPPLDVHVNFFSGVLSQFYPYALTEGAMLNGDIPYLFLGKEGINEKVTTGLIWRGVQLGSNEKPVETDDKVWTTPREVSAPLLQVKFSYKDGTGAVHDVTQAEHFLFYRGVAHLDSPLRLVDSVRGQVGTTTHLRVFPQSGRDDPVVTYAWLAEIHPDGACAFQALSSFGGVKIEGAKEASSALATVNLTSSASFPSEAFSADNLAKLKASMRDALIQEGLYPDEASAMLRTWELSYFKSPGLRFFYLVNRAWVDKALPLTITGAPTDITRVMVGRIELITDAQRAALARLAAGPCPDLAAVRKAALAAVEKSALSKSEVDAFYRGEKPLTELGVPIPPLVRDYLSLGRFRDALVIHEQAQSPSPALAQFIKENRLATEAN